MALKIVHRSLFRRDFLIVKRDCFKIYEYGMFFGARRFLFSDIRCVLMSPEHKLSVQVGNEVFSIRTRPDKKKHQDTIAALVAGAETSQRSATSSVRYSP